MVGHRSPIVRLLPVLVASAGGILFGYGTGVIAGVLPLASVAYHMSAWEQSAAVSAALLGAALTAPSGGRLADRFGRRPALATATLVFLLGTVVSSIAADAETLLAGRFLVGLAVGTTSFAVPLYISEISPPGRRGALVTLNQLMITVGLLSSYAAAYLLEPIGAWRAMLALGLVPALLFLIGVLSIPESPLWLSDRERLRELGWRTDAGGAPHRSGRRGHRGASSLVDACAEAGPRWVILGLAMAVLVHFTGLNTAIYYAPTILAASGLTVSDGVLGSVLVGVCNLGATVVSLVLMDRVGRRKLMIGGLAVMAGSALSIAVAHQAGLGGIVIAVMLSVFITAGAVGPAAVFWVYVAEIFPSRVRGTLVSLATAAHWAADFVIAVTFLPLADSLSLGGVFSLYTAVTAVSALIFWKWMPETRGRDLMAAHTTTRKGNSDGQ